MSNALRIDPTRTTMLRRAFMTDLNRRFNALDRELMAVVVTENAFGLGGLTANTRFKFLPDVSKVKTFSSWLNGLIKKHVLNVHDDSGDPPGWFRRYIQLATGKGAKAAYDLVARKVTKSTDPGYQGFLRSAFNAPLAVERFELLATRAFSDLVGVTEGMAKSMRQILTDGLLNGKHPYEVGRELRKGLGMTKRRAETIARTEIIRAHNEGSLVGYENLGVEELGIMVEWLGTKDGRMCPKCAAMVGTIMKVEEAKGVLPRHPNCRCAWIPAPRRKRTDVATSVKKSVALESGKKPLKQKLKQSVWAGADLAGS